MKIIRKISVGKDYKEAMHYSLGQKVYGENVISDIEEIEDCYVIYIDKENHSKVWKQFNKNLPISIEFDIDYK